MKRAGALRKIKNKLQNHVIIQDCLFLIGCFAIILVAIGLTLLFEHHGINPILW